MTQAADNRRKDVLRAVILEYLRCGEPVGSSNLCDRYDLGVSPATVRNDLADLVDAGLLVQPHTSAGRLPSERGYRTYVDEFLGDAEVSNNQRERIVLAMKAFEYRRERAAQEFARMVAEISGEAVVMRYGSEGATLLTGLKNLASKPEAKTGRVMIDFSAALDDIDGTLEKISAQLTEDVTILVGEGNPFGDDLSAVFADIEVSGIGRALIGIIGPQRMDYDRAVALMRILKQQGVRLIE